MTHRLVRNRRHYTGPGVYCGRPGEDGNPFVIGKDGTRAEVIAKHKAWFLAKPQAERDAIKERLRGKILICWCAPDDCHCDFVAEYVNA